MAKTRLELTWYNKDKALIPVEKGKYDYKWVDPSDPRYCETRTLVYDEYIRGKQSQKTSKYQYSERADLTPQEDNLLVLGESGDVLEALTRIPELAEKYVGQVKLIYIDPPFNTAKTFSSYEDNLEHSIWLTMMRDRLLHLKKLLSDEGSIWVHLDDSEVHRMRLLMDEVFGSNQYISEIAWEKTFKPRNDADYISGRHDVILVYRKSSSFSVNKLPRTTEMNTAYINPDKDPKGAWTSAPATAADARFHQGMVYGVQHPVTGELLYPPLDQHWRFGQDRFLEILKEWNPNYELRDLNDVEKRADLCGVTPEAVRTPVQAVVISDFHKEDALSRYSKGNWPIVYVTKEGLGGFRKKTYLSEAEGRTIEDIWFQSEVGSNDEAKNEIKALFPGDSPFDTPKPERLLERIMHISTSPGDIVLDCFAGSGTTAAVAQKMGRRWVTCELLESNFYSYDLPRLTKVVNDEDPGGITKTAGERIPAEGVELPDGISAEDAAKFTKVLNKLISDHDEMKKDSMIKWLKAQAKTKRLKTVVNWRGGGGFQVAHLSSSCFDYDEEFDRVLLTPDATGETLIRSVAANLGYTMLSIDKAGVFDARRGNSYLKVVEGVATIETVDWLTSNLHSEETVVIAALSIMDGVREHLRKSCKGSRIVILPDDMFHYQGGEDK